MSHKYTVESIYSFTCSKCGNWWSYSHVARKYDLKLPDAMKTMYCPHCGFEDLVVKKSKWEWDHEQGS